MTEASNHSPCLNQHTMLTLSEKEEFLNVCCCSCFLFFLGKIKRKIGEKMKQEEKETRDSKKLEDNDVWAPLLVGV